MVVAARGRSRAIKRREVGQQDKTIGVAELADAIRTRPAVVSAARFHAASDGADDRHPGGGNGGRAGQADDDLRADRAAAGDPGGAGETIPRARPPGPISRAIDAMLVRMHDKR